MAYGRYQFKYFQRNLEKGKNCCGPMNFIETTSKIAHEWKKLLKIRRATKAVFNGQIAKKKTRKRPPTLPLSSLRGNPFGFNKLAIWTGMFACSRSSSPLRSLLHSCFYQGIFPTSMLIFWAKKCRRLGNFALHTRCFRPSNSFTKFSRKDRSDAHG